MSGQDNANPPPDNEGDKGPSESNGKGPTTLLGLIGQLATKDATSARLEFIGILAFATLALALIILIVGFNFFTIHITERQQHGVIFQSAAVLSTLAIASLLLIVISRLNNAWSAVLGFFIFGALLVPPSDIMRFALLVFDSDRKIGEFYETEGLNQIWGIQATPGTEKPSAHSHLASTIVDDLLSTGSVSEFGSQQERSEAVRTISMTLANDRIRTLSTIVYARDLHPILKAIENDTFEALYFAHKDNGRFISDLDFLDSSGLITVLYNDYLTAKIEPLGEQVYQFTTELERAIDRSLILGGQPTQETNIIQQITNDDEPISPSPLDLTQPVEHRLEIGLETHFFSFSVIQGQTYRFIARPIDDLADPIIYLVRTDPQGGPRIVAIDDDSAGNLGSLLDAPLEPNTNYLLAVTSYLPSEIGMVDFTVDLSPSAQPQTATEAPQADETNTREPDGSTE